MKGAPLLTLLPGSDRREEGKQPVVIDVDYNDALRAFQGSDDGEDHPDLPMTFRWRVPPGIRDCRSLPWTGNAKRDHAIAGIVTEALAVAGTDMKVSVSLNWNWYTGRERVVGAGFTYSNVRYALTVLEAGGWITVVKGEKRKGGSGIQTAFWPTEQLTQTISPEITFVYGVRDPIIMRDAFGLMQPVPDTREMGRIRERMKRRNEAYAATDLRLDAPDITWTADKPMWIDGRWCDPRRNQAHAVFNGGTRLGGRHYGLFYQTLSQREHGRRDQLMKDGKPVDEPDFSGCHPNQLYHERGLNPDGDLYTVTHDAYGRDESKLAMQCLINASGERSALEGFAYKLACAEAKADLKAGGPKLSPVEIDARAMGHMPDAVRLFDALKDRHAPIAGAFFTGAGTRLQYVETVIMQRAALECLDRGIVVYPMHDSAITGAGYEAGILREAMARSWRQETGFEAKIG